MYILLQTNHRVFVIQSVPAVMFLFQEFTWACRSSPSPSTQLLPAVCILSLTPCDLFLSVPHTESKQASISETSLSRRCHHRGKEVCVSHESLAEVAAILPLVYSKRPLVRTDENSQTEPPNTFIYPAAASADQSQHAGRRAGARQKHRKHVQAATEVWLHLAMIRWLQLGNHRTGGFSSLCPSHCPSISWSITSSTSISWCDLLHLPAPDPNPFDPFLDAPIHSSLDSSIYRSSHLSIYFSICPPGHFLYPSRIVSTSRSILFSGHYLYYWCYTLLIKKKASIHLWIHLSLDVPSLDPPEYRSVSSPVRPLVCLSTSASVSWTTLLFFIYATINPSISGCSRPFLFSFIFASTLWVSPSPGPPTDLPIYPSSDPPIH